MEKPIRSCLETLKLMTESEQAVAQFYLLCSQEFAEYNTFWAALANEELGHAKVIRRLIELVRIQPSEFSAGKSAPLDATRSFIAWVNSKIESLRRNQLSEEKALLTAYQIENTFIELRYADVMKTENADYKALLGQIISETLKHKEKIAARNRILKDERASRRKQSS